MSEAPSSPTHHVRRYAALAAVVAILALYFLAPDFLFLPVSRAVRWGYLPTVTAQRLALTLFKPVYWLQSRSPTYTRFLEAEFKLCYKIFGGPL